MLFPKKTYKKRKPSLANRGKFSDKTISQILERDDYKCVVCLSQADDIHHVKYKSAGGRGIFTNGMCLCRNCHDHAHSSNKERKRLEQIMIDKYGTDYFRDEYDNYE